MKFKLYILSILLFVFYASIASNSEKHGLSFIENKGQWEDNILFQANLPNGKIYLEDSCLTFLIYDKEDFDKIHDAHHGHYSPGEDGFLIKCHAFKMYFDNSNTNSIKTSSFVQHDYVNYFIGNDKRKWASKVQKYGMVTYENIFNNIDFKIYSLGTDIKYDFVVHPGGNPEDISYSFEGLDYITQTNNRLFLGTSVYNLIDNEPISYQNDKQLNTRYQLNGNNVTFSVEDYDPDLDLIIDPLLVFASYSGSTSDNWGYTATYDNEGHAYSGGIAFNIGYPTTTGAFQTNFNGGSGINYPGFEVGVDATIMKFSPKGDTLIYSTYLGGANSVESPHSLVVDNSNQLIIMGTTSSNDFPTSTNAYDNTFNGGTPKQITVVNYEFGSDIFITKLSPDGSNLVGSTYLGGSLNDGLNTGSLRYNYADDFRGEIIADNNNNCIVATTTFSDDFPTTANAAQTVNGGKQDGCIFKLNNDLSSIEWSSYIGGSEDDAAYGIQFNTAGETYFTGGTNSPDFPATNNVINPNFQGTTDAFVTKLNASGTNFDYSTYLGTASFDQAYFVQLDSIDNVYILGQTEGDYPVLPNVTDVYNNPTSGQFIHKLSSSLDNTIFSTVIGSAQGKVDISLSAFLVNSCNQIYISGWGGDVNVSNSGPAFSSTNGLPVTSDALQASTDGNDFYFMVLENDAKSLQYATFFGGNASREHVDGGTSRFDKNGIIYQGVCAGCGGNSDFPTTVGTWSENNQASNCNIGTIKFNLSSLSVATSVIEPKLCVPGTAVFINDTEGATSFLWNFGDGGSSTEFSPTHVYSDTGTYTVQLIAYDPASCIYSDTAEVEVIVSMPPTLSITPEVEICPNTPTNLTANGTVNYIWQPADYFDNPTSASPLITTDEEITVTITGYNFCGSDEKTVTVTLFENNTSTTSDSSICIGNTLAISASGGVIYNWLNNGSIANTSSSTAIVTPNENTLYHVTITDANGCAWEDEIFIEVNNDIPNIVIPADTLICFGEDLIINVSGGTNYYWSGGIITKLNNDGSQIIVAPESNTTYTVEAVNSCGESVEEISIAVSSGPSLNTTPLIETCPNEYVTLFAESSGTIEWSPSDKLDNAFINEPIYFAESDQKFYIVSSDNCGNSKDSVMVILFKDETQVSEDDFICIGESITLEASGGTQYEWGPSGITNTPFANEITITPTTSEYYTIKINDNNDCTWEKEIYIEVNTDIPIAEISNDTSICYADTIGLSASGGAAYEWNTTAWISHNDSSFTYTAPLSTSKYEVFVVNGCGSDTAEVIVNVNRIQSNTPEQITTCFGYKATLKASGGTAYLWSPTEPLDDFTSPSPSLTVTEPQLFTVKIVDELSCEALYEVFVDTFPRNNIKTNPEILVEYGKTGVLFAKAKNEGSYLWSPKELVSCDTCQLITIYPKESGYFYVSTKDENGCVASDSVYVYVSGSLYVPNTFTPNGDQINDVFFAYGKEIKQFDLRIFNRWGDQIFESNDINLGWDGKHNGNYCPDGTYIWKIVYEESSGYKGNLVGHVNLLR